MINQPLPIRSPGSIKKEYKRPLTYTTTNGNGSKLLPFHQQAFTSEIEDSISPSTPPTMRRIENFNIYEEYMLRNNELTDEDYDEDDDEELRQIEAPANYQTRMTPKSSLSVGSGSGSLTPKSKKTVGFNLKPRVLYPDEDPEITKILTSQDDSEEDMLSPFTVDGGRRKRGGGNI